MTRIIGAILVATVLTLGWWNQVLELRNAELGSALALARQHEPSDRRVCGELIAVARGGDYTATLQMATRMFKQYRSGARTGE